MNRKGGICELKRSQLGGGSLIFAKANLLYFPKTLHIFGRCCPAMKPANKVLVIGWNHDEFKIL